MIDTLIGQRYRIKALIGEGGMASVYSALDEKLERRVAIKILHPHLARNVDIRERFLLEAKTVSSLDHPNILRVYDFSGLDSEQLWMVMEILYGEDLAEYVKAFPKHRLQFVVATLITREICRALHEAHKLNIVHRDIKPENIMMLTNGQLKLMDFGIAKVHRANATQTGIFMGSPSYMSPEQIRGTDVDARADIYSLSVLYYEIITGTLPFVGKTTAEVINRIMVGRYTPPNMLITELPYGLNQIVIKGMQGHKEERYQTVAEMGEALDSFLQNCNLRESRTELEEFSLNRAKFEERLSQIIAPKPKAPPAPASSLTFNEEKAPAIRSQATRYHAPYEEGGKGQGDSRNQLADHLSPHSPDSKGDVEQNATMLLDGALLPTLPPKAQGSEQAPASSLPEGDKGRNPKSSKSVDKKEQSKGKAAASAQPKPQAQGQSANQAKGVTAPQKMKHRSQTVGPSRNNPRQTTGNFQSPVRSSTQPPRTSHVASNPKNTQQRAYYREFAEDEKKSRKSSFGLIGFLTLIAAAAALVIFGGDRVARRVITQFSGHPTETASRLPKKPKLDSQPADATPSVPAVETDAPVDLKPPVDIKNPAEDVTSTALESTTIVIPVDGKGKPKIPTNVVAPSAKPPIPAKRTEPKIAVKPDPIPASVNSKIPAQPAPGPTKKPDPSSLLVSIPPDRTPDDKVPETKPNEKQPASNEPGVLRLAALPAAEVYLDGKMYGTTNDKQFGSQGLKLDPGTYKLQLKRKGYRTDEKAIQIKAGEMRQINVTLTKAAELLELSVQANKIPATIVIEENKAGGRRRDIPMVKHNMTINLKAGSYKVTVSREQQSLTRNVELSEENKSSTFNADFK